MLRKLHFLNAGLLGTFLVVHLANHLVAVIGPEAHIDLMESLRGVYRTSLIEISLLALFAGQILLGFTLMLQRGRPTSRWAWAQVFSGGYIALFLLQHLGAVLFMRLTTELDTNFYWAASVVSTDPIRWYFLPYYWLGVAAIFIHIAAALHFRRAVHPKAPVMLVGTGLLLATGVVTALSGGMYEFGLPPSYQVYLSEMYPVW